MGFGLNTLEVLSHYKERGRVKEIVCMWEEVKLEKYNYVTVI